MTIAEALALTGAMGTVLAVWATLFAVLAGVGRAALWAALGRASARGVALPACAWMGYAATLATLQLWHFVLPIGAATWLPLLAASAAGWWIARPRPRPPGVGRWGPWSMAFFALLTVWAANRAIGPMSNFDCANYRLPLIAWFRAAPVVPGLANLQSHFGYNLSGLLVPALLEVGPGVDRSSHFGNGVLWILALATCVQALESARRRQRLDAGAAAALVALWAIVSRIHLNGGYWLTSTAPDLGLLMVALSLVVLACDALAGDATGGGGTGEQRHSAAVVALSLAMIAPLVKSSGLVFGAGVALILLFALRRLPPSTTAAARKGLVAALGFALVSIGGWIARGILLSGYPLYPLPVLGVDVDWRVPRETVEFVLWWTTVWAKTPGSFDAMIDRQAGLDWVPHWWRVDLRSGLEEALTPIAFTLALLGLAAFATLGPFARGSRPAQAPSASTPAETRRPALGWLLLPILVGLGTWFVSAPSVRFGQFLFWSLAAMAGALVLPRIEPRIAPAARWLPWCMALAVVGSITVHGYYTLRDRGARSRSEALLIRFLTPPGPDRGFHPLHRPAMSTLEVCDGRLALRRPAVGMEELGRPEWRDLLSWATPPPTTSTPLVEDLCARVPGDAARGFRIERAGQEWAERHGETVRRFAATHDWPLARLAIYFEVRPELIREAIRRETLPASP